MMGRENASIADRFVSVMADIARMDEGMANDAPERFAVWLMKDAAQAHLCDAIMSARREVEACLMLRDAMKADDQAAELRRDRERLDHLEKYAVIAKPGQPIRAAIDEAMKTPNAKVKGAAQ